jgi:hypothetical protein
MFGLQIATRIEQQDCLVDTRLHSMAGPEGPTATPITLRRGAEGGVTRLSHNVWKGTATCPNALSWKQ